MPERQPLHRQALPAEPVSASPEAAEPASDPRLQAALQTLERGIDQILTSDGFADFLKTMSRFHEYSANNIMLIMTQRPDASKVAGYRKWQDLGRQVKRGEQAIKIFVPHLYRDKNDLDEEGKPREKLAGYGIGNVFDIAQTDGKPLPEPPRAKKLETQSARGDQLYTALAGLMDRCGVTTKRLPGPHNGFYRPADKLIVVNFKLHGDQAAKTLAHEAAHAVAGNRGLEAREDAETVAESSAFVVLNHFGIDSSEYTFPYVAAWAANRKVLQRNLSAIQQTSHFLIAGCERLMPQEQPDQPVTIYDRPLSRDELRPPRGLGGTRPHG